jgi:hypothetical protein
MSRPAGAINNSSYLVTRKGVTIFARESTQVRARWPTLPCTCLRYSPKGPQPSLSTSSSILPLLQHPDIVSLHYPCPCLPVGSALARSVQLQFCKNATDCYFQPDLKHIRFGRKAHRRVALAKTSRTSPDLLHLTLYRLRNCPKDVVLASSTRVLQDCQTSRVPAPLQTFRILQPSILPCSSCSNESNESCFATFEYRTAS